MKFTNPMVESSSDGDAASSDDGDNNDTWHGSYDFNELPPGYLLLVDAWDQIELGSQGPTHTEEVAKDSRDFLFSRWVSIARKLKTQFYRFDSGDDPEESKWAHGNYINESELKSLLLWAAEEATPNRTSDSLALIPREGIDSTEQKDSPTGEPAGEIEEWNQKKSRLQAIYTELSDLENTKKTKNKIDDRAVEAYIRLKGWVLGRLGTITDHSETEHKSYHGKVVYARKTLAGVQQLIKAWSPTDGGAEKIFMRKWPEVIGESKGLPKDWPPQPDRWRNERSDKESDKESMQYWKTAKEEAFDCFQAGAGTKKAEVLQRKLEMIFSEEIFFAVDLCEPVNSTASWDSLF